jgi:hypothetical protein
VIWWAARKALYQKQGSVHDQSIPFTNYPAPMGHGGQQAWQGKSDVEGGQYAMSAPAYQYTTAEPYRYYPPPNVAGYEA